MKCINLIEVIEQRKNNLKTKKSTSIMMWGDLEEEAPHWKHKQTDQQKVEKYPQRGNRGNEREKEYGEKEK